MAAAAVAAAANAKGDIMFEINMNCDINNIGFVKYMNEADKKTIAKTEIQNDIWNGSERPYNEKYDNVENIP